MRRVCIILWFPKKKVSPPFWEWMCRLDKAHKSSIYICRQHIYEVSFLVERVRP